MLDSFDSENYEDYSAGFPLHPHRGIETITYIAEGSVIHEDTIGNKKKIGNRQIQWMNSGSGILHSEYFDEEKLLRGVQLWLNLPAKEKMSAPSYREVKTEDIVTIDYGAAKIQLYSGSFKEYTGKSGEHLPLDFYSISLKKGESVELPVKKGNTLLLFSLVGNFNIGGQKVMEKSCVKTTEGSSIEVESLSEENELLWMSAPPLNEPIAWGGPIVMNTADELLEAFKELKEDKFIK